MEKKLKSNKSNKYMGYYERFSKKIFLKIFPFLEKESNYERRMEDFKKGKIRKPKDVIYTNKQKYWYDIVLFLKEIEESFERLRFYPKFLQSYSSNYEKQGFSRAQQFLYHIENYLSEVYILRERIKNLLGKIRKKGEKANISSKNLTILRKLKDYVYDSMGSIVAVRGDHIHSHRYLDEDLKRLKLEDFLLNSGFITKKQKEQSKFRVKLFLMMSRHKWKDQIKKNNQDTKKMLDHVCYDLYKSNILAVIAKKL